MFTTFFSDTQDVGIVTRVQVIPRAPGTFTIRMHQQEYAGSYPPRFPLSTHYSDVGVSVTCGNITVPSTEIIVLPPTALSANVSPLRTYYAALANVVPLSDGTDSVSIPGSVQLDDNSINVMVRMSDAFESYTSSSLSMSALDSCTFTVQDIVPAAGANNASSQSVTMSVSAATHMEVPDAAH